jgi:hypothetical protein
MRVASYSPSTEGNEMIKYSWEDRLIAIAGLVAIFMVLSMIVAMIAYDTGYDEASRVAARNCKPKVVRPVYSTEEMGRMYRARQRMEKVK